MNCISGAQQPRTQRTTNAHTWLNLRYIDAIRESFIWHLNGVEFVARQPLTQNDDDIHIIVDAVVVVAK